MAKIIEMPKLGFNMSEGKLVQWYKQEGDAVKKGESLFSVETDKTNMDIEATEDAVVRKLLIGEGDSLPVTLPIAIVGTAEEDITSVLKEAEDKLGGRAPASPAAADDASPDESTPAAASVSAEPVPVTNEGRMKISPRARRVAKEHGLSLEGLAIRGTGWEGGICEKDILQYLEANKTRVTPLAKAVAAGKGVDLANVQGTGENGKIKRADVEAAAKAEAATASAEAPAEKSSGEVTPDGKRIAEKVPYEGVRKVIGERMSQSKFTAPHLYFNQKVNMEKLLSMRKEVNAVQDHKTSVTDYIGMAMVKTLQEFPDVNASLIGKDHIERYASVNLGIAVAAKSGLIVPNVKEAQDMSLLEFSKASAVLVKKAREGRLMPDEYAGATCTISNLGMTGLDNFTAIINQPEVAILAISATKDEPVVVVDEQGEKQIAIKPIMNIQLTVDHRVIDGYMAAQFVTAVKEKLENPMVLMV